MICPHCRGVGAVETSLGATVCSACKGSGERDDTQAARECVEAFRPLAEVAARARQDRPQPAPTLRKYVCDYCEEEEAARVDLDGERCPYVHENRRSVRRCPGTLRAVLTADDIAEIKADNARNDELDRRSE